MHYGAPTTFVVTEMKNSTEDNFSEFKTNFHFTYWCFFAFNFSPQLYIACSFPSFFRRSCTKPYKWKFSTYSRRTFSSLCLDINLFKDKHISLRIGKLSIASLKKKNSIQTTCRFKNEKFGQVNFNFGGL